MRHATDPDHVIAVTTIVARQRSIKHAALIGILWGLGHTITILVVGTAIILFRLVIPPRIGLALELSVGFMLVLLGILNLTGTLNWIRHRIGAGGRARLPLHAHGIFLHSHVSGVIAGLRGEAEMSKPEDSLDRALNSLGLFQIFRPLVVGVVHGLAGSAAVALLVLATIPNPLWAIVYLSIFGVGTIAGMMLITAAVALPFAWTGYRFAGLQRHLAVASGLVSVCFGLFLAYQIGFVDGLFSSHPHWTPR